MNCKNNGIDYQNSNISGQFCCAGAPVLTYEICVPTVKTNSLFHATHRVNDFYRADGAAFTKALRLQQLPNALQNYRMLAPCGEFLCWSVRRYYTQMYSRPGLNSIFLDTYCHLGEGSQRLSRVAHTFSANCGKMKLCDFFKHGYNYYAAFYEHIYDEICRNAALSPSQFYNDWQAQLSRSFCVQNYYLADDGFVVFFPQRTLAPLACGIISFLVPYSVFGSNLICEL